MTAVSRLLGRAVDASGPDVVRRALLREACGLLALPVAAVLRTEGTGREQRRLRIAAASPQAPTAPPIDLVAVPAVAEVADGRAPLLRLRRSDAVGLAAALGIGSDGFGELVLVGMRAESDGGTCSRSRRLVAAP